MSDDEREDREGRPSSDEAGDAGAAAEDRALDEFVRGVDWEAWRAPSPPADFAQRVVQRAYPRAPRAQAARARRRSAPAWLAAALLLALGAWLAAVAFERGAGDVSGERLAAERLELAIGRRAVAVLEAGARVRWRDERVTQSAGDVFYRAEPGGSFMVSTPNGSVEVLGTCFRVNVEPDAGVAGTAVTRVNVYEGRVWLLAAGQTLELGAGGAARLDSAGVQRLPSRDGEARVRAPEQPEPAPPVDAGAARRDALASEIAGLRAELASLKRQQGALDERVRAARERLIQVGGEVRERHRYDLTPDDWRKLAEKGSVMFRLPCARPNFRVRPEQLDRLGLMPDDAAVIEQAYADSRERVWRALRPLCVSALSGDAAVVDLLGREGCITAVQRVELERDGASADAAMRQVGEIRAGLRPPPAPGAALHPLLEMFLLLTGEPAAFEAQLAESLGPDDAKRIAYSDDMCHERATLEGSDPREE